MVKHRPSRSRVWAECTTTAQGSDAVFDLCVQDAPESGNRILFKILFILIYIFYTNRVGNKCMVHLIVSGCCKAKL